MRKVSLLAGVALSAILLAGPAMAQSYKMQLVTKIKLPGKTGHGDLVTFDPSNKMVYVSLVDDGLAVIDTATNTVAHYIQNIPAPNGSAADADNVYVTCAEGAGAAKVNAIAVIDKKTWKEVGRTKIQSTSPDWIGIAGNTIYTDSDDGNQIEVYSTGTTPAFKAKWPLFPDKPKAGPDVATLLPDMHKIYQSDDSFVEVLDTNTGAVTQHVDLGVKLTDKGGAKGSVYDAKNNRLWVGTTTGGAFVLDAASLKTIKKLPLKGGADQVSLDPGLGLAYFFEGGAKGFDVYDVNTMQHVAFVSTGIGQTHTGDVDPNTHLVYAYEGDGATVAVYKPVE